MVTTTQTNKPKLITRPKTMISSTTVTKPNSSLPSAPSSSQPTSRPQHKPSYTIYGQNNNVPTGTEAIRPFFESRGYKVDWDPTQNVVTIPGSNVAIRPDANIGGSTFANTDTLNSALKGLGYKSPQEKERDTAAKRYNDMLSEIEQMMRTPVQYDPEDDPRYQAFRDLYNQQAEVASRNAMETLNDRGLLDSSMTRSDIAQIQQNAEQQALAHIPQFYAEAQEEHNQRIRDILDLIGVYDTQEQKMYDRGNLEEDRAAAEREAQRLAEAEKKAANIENAKLLSETFGIGIMPKDSGSALFEQVAGLPTVEAMTEQREYFSELIDASDKLGYVLPELAQIIGVQPYTNTLSAQKEINDAAYRMGMLGVSRQNAATSSRNADIRADELALSREREQRLSSEGEEFDYNTDPDFQADYAYIIKNPEQARSELATYADQFIAKYGVDGYNRLIDALPKEEE